MTKADNAPREQSHHRFLRYVANRGWVHLLMLTFAALFLFPFVWMLNTSFKTDEEVSEHHFHVFFHTFNGQEALEYGLPFFQYFFVFNSEGDLRFDPI